MLNPAPYWHVSQKVTVYDYDKCKNENKKTESLFPTLPFSAHTQINNPDMRVQILKDFVKLHFPATQLLDYALDVEKITTSKVRQRDHTITVLFTATVQY